MPGRDSSIDISFSISYNRNYRNVLGYLEEGNELQDQRKTSGKPF